MGKVTVRWKGTPVEIPIEGDSERADALINQLTEVTGVPSEGIRLMGGRGITGKGKNRVVLAGATIMMTGTTSDEKQRVDKFAEEAKSQIAVVDDLVETAELAVHPSLPVLRAQRPSRSQATRTGELSRLREDDDDLMEFGGPDTPPLPRAPSPTRRSGAMPGVEEIDSLLANSGVRCGQNFRDMNGVSQAVDWMEEGRFDEALRVAKRKRKLIVVVFAAAETQGRVKVDEETEREGGVMNNVSGTAGDGEMNDEQRTTESATFLGEVLEDERVACCIAKHFLIWGADVGGMTASGEQTVSFLGGFDVNALPVCLVLGHISGSTLMMDLFAFTATDSASTVLQRLEAVNNSCSVFSGTEQAAADGQALQSSEALRAEQDREYQESLAADRERERAAVAASARAAESARARAALPAEPTAGSAEIVVVAVRMPDGARVKRRFRAGDKMSSIFDLCTAEGCGFGEEFDVVTDFPRRAFTLESDGETPLGNTGAVASAVFHVEPRSARGSDP